MKFINVLLLTYILLISQNILAQQYTSPLDFNLLLSGTFGELRNNHFHAGIDIKTEGVEGQKVRSIADGYISRIKVSTWGYGKVIYITHPETGHTSVYAHLQRFNERINSFVKKEHYQKEQFEIEYFPKKNDLPVSQGEIIALSGNSGGSSGAHLHFEIRESKNAHPINPLKFKFSINDNIPPTLKKLKIYAFDTTLINGYNKSRTYNLKKKNNTYYLEEEITINGNFALGIFTYDQSDGSYNKNGVYKISLYVDDSLHYEFKADELDFKTNRYINAHIDYCEKIENRKKYHRCYKLPHNKLKNYSNLVNNGIINFNDSLPHKINLEVSDIFGNISNISFKVKSTNQPFLRKCPAPKDPLNTFFKFNTANIFKKKNISLHMQAFSLYESIMFHYNTSDSISGIFGEIHHIHYNNTPVHKKYVLALKANIANSLKNKTYIATTDMKGGFSYVGGEWVNGFLKTKTRKFGNFCIVADTIMPKITELNIFEGKVLKNQNTIKLRIEDKNSGIKSYRGEIDGKWILMDYDHKKGLLYFDIDQNINKGEHTFKLKVIDNVNNTKEYKAKFTY